MKYELRERAHDLMRAELVEAAFALLVEDGYDAYTTDELAKALGISRATFFRYLNSKDDVIVAAMLGPAPQFGEAYADATHDIGASEWSRLREAFEPAVLLADTQPERQRARLRLIQSQPTVGAKLRRARAPQIENLADALVTAGQDVFAAHVLATAAIAVLDHCWAQWARDEHASMRALLDRAFEQLEAAATPTRAA